MEHIDGKVMHQSLTALHGDALRSVYALLTKVNIGNLFATKAKDLLTPNSTSHFAEHLAQEADKLKNIPESELRLHLFLELLALTKTRGGRFDFQEEIDQACDDVVNVVFADFVKNNKAIRKSGVHQSVNSKLGAMIQWQMDEVFKQFDDKIQKLSEEDLDKTIQNIQEYIKSLPEEQQQKIKDKLGIQDVSDAVVRNLLVQSGTSVLFAIIVEVSGFAFYTTAMSMIASVAGFVGLTLPFAFYTTAASSIAFLSNPLFIVPAVVGGGAVYVKHQNNSLRKKLLPVILMQVRLAGMNEEVDESVISEVWKPHFEKYKFRKYEWQMINKKLKECEKEIEKKEKDETTYKKEVLSLSGKITRKQGLIASMLQKDMFRPSFPRLSGELQRIESEITTNRHRILKGKDRNNNFFGKMLQGVSTGALHTKNSFLEMKRNSIFHQMAEQVVLGRVQYAKDEMKIVKELQGKTKICNENLTRTTNELNRWNDDKRAVSTKKFMLEVEVTRLEKEIYGLNHIRMDEGAIAYEGDQEQKVLELME